jgi:ribose 5-phosphate isomerase A
MTIYERAADFITDGAQVGLGSGHAAEAFVRLLGERVRAGRLRAYGLPTSTETAALAQQVGIPLLAPEQAGVLDLTVDGADEVDPRLDLIKGYGRRLVREKIVAAMSRRLVILVGEEKLVPQLGTRGKLPVEVVPFGMPLCARRLADLGCPGDVYTEQGRPYVTDNGNFILDAAVGPLADPAQLERDLRAIPGVVGTGLFLGIADTVLVGAGADFRLIDERRR